MTFILVCEGRRGLVTTVTRYSQAGQRWDTCTMTLTNVDFRFIESMYNGNTMQMLI